MSAPFNETSVQVGPETTADTEHRREKIVEPELVDGLEEQLTAINLTVSSNKTAVNETMVNNNTALLGKRRHMKKTKFLFERQLITKYFEIDLKNT